MLKLKDMKTSHWPEANSSVHPVDQFAVTCLIQPLNSYKSESLIQLKTALKMNQRDGIDIEPGARIPIVVIQTDANVDLCDSGESPDYVKEKRLKLDMVYYLKNHLLKALLPLLDYHPNLKQRVQHASRSIIMQMKHQNTGQMTFAKFLQNKKQ
jgi:DNA polymerase elongation subunit (family B)